MSLLSWQVQVRNIKSHFVNLLFPPVCVQCRKVGELLCQDCVAKLIWLQAPVCEICGRTLPETAAPCLVCRKRPLPLKQIRAAFLFDGIIPNIIHQLKYRNAFALAEPLGTLMAESWPQWQTSVDMVMPIPLHHQREKKRGYNQSDLLVNTFCRQLTFTKNNSVLKRSRITPPQVGLNAEERQANVRGAFSVEDPHPVKGKEILLVDDVCTTGATLAAAAEVLLSAGASNVSAYCLARAI